MDSSTQDYPALLAALDPKDAVSVLNNRVESISRTNLYIADWLLERRKVEESYAQGLWKLARKTQRDGGASLGIFQIPWQRIVESTESLAHSHEGLAQRIEVDAEIPLRQFATENQGMLGISRAQGNLALVAKNMDNAQKRAEKLKDKSGRHSTSRVTNATSSADDTNQQWEAQAPYVFEQLQSLDQTRVNHLRDILTQFQTHEIDSIEQNRKPAEMCLNALLNVETADEIKTFASRISTDPRIGTLPRRGSSASNQVGRASSSGRGNAPPIPPPPRITADPSRSPPSLQKGDKQRGLGIEAVETPKRPGLKSRLGTVMGRRKNATQLQSSSAEKTKKEKNRTSMMPFRRGDSSKITPNFEAASATGRTLTPVLSREESNSAETPLRVVDTDGRSQTNLQGQEEPRGDSVAVNGIISTGSEPHGNRTNASVNGTTPSNNVIASYPQPPHELGVTPPSPIQHTDIISRAQQEAAAVNAENEESVRRLKIRDQPIQEDETEAQQAMSNMANQLRLQAQTSGVNRLAGSMRGRRDVRNTVFVPNPEPSIPDDEPTGPSDPEPSAPAEAIPLTAGSPADELTASMAKAPAIMSEERTTSDTTSVRSAQSLGRIVHHPEMPEPGLNASIVENVSTWFSDGKVSKSFVIGEVALAYNPSQESRDKEIIRLDNFQMLEKIAPNPSFVSSIASEKGKERATSDAGAGEYRVGLSAIKRSTPVVAFKYQLHLDSSALSAHSPLLFTPSWQIQDAQASVIVVYTLNPAFGLSRSANESSSEPIILKNVVVSITLDPSPDAGKATSAMMAPQNGAAFKRKQGLVIWRFPELVVSDEQQRLLARFVTTGGAKARPGHIEAKWELPDITGSKLGVRVLRGAEGGNEAAGDPFADEGTTAGTSAHVWSEVHTARSLISGRYSTA